MSKTRDPSDPIRLTIPPRTADKKKKLGRGLGALMGETRKEEPLVRTQAEVGQSVGAQAPVRLPVHLPVRLKV